MDLVTEENEVWSDIPRATGQVTMRQCPQHSHLPPTPHPPAGPGSNQEAVISRTTSHPQAKVSELCPRGLSQLSQATLWRACCASSCSAPPWPAFYCQGKVVSTPQPADGRGGHQGGGERVRSQSDALAPAWWVPVPRQRLA